MSNTKVFGKLAGIPVKALQYPIQGALTAVGKKELANEVGETGKEFREKFGNIAKKTGRVFTGVGVYGGKRKTRKPKKSNRKTRKNRK